MTAIRAVLFDLFGTLIPYATRQQRSAVFHGMAEDLDLPATNIQEAYRHSFDQRARGQFGSLKSTLDILARRLNSRPTPVQLEAAVNRRLQLNRHLHNQCWATATLTRLRAGGIGVGIVTDTTAETVEVWDQSPLHSLMDVVSFSCQTGIRKPAPRAYLTATERLGIAPANCLYIGDGSSQEISGAQELGMKTLKFTPSHQVSDSLPAHAQNDWNGKSFNNFDDIPLLLGRRVINLTDSATGNEDADYTDPFRLTRHR